MSFVFSHIGVCFNIYISRSFISVQPVPVNHRNNQMRQHPFVLHEFGLHSIILFASLDFFPRISKPPTPPPANISSFQQASNQTLFPLQQKTIPDL